jgi:phage terminase small subunit
MSRKPIPTKLKVLMGNPGKRKSDIQKNEPKLPTEMPQMPEWLTAFPEAVKEWDRESVILFNMGVLTIADAGTFATRCFLSSQIQEAAIALKNTDGEKCYTQIKALITEYRQVGSLLGLDPASRTKLTVNPTDKKKSKFDGLISVKK